MGKKELGAGQWGMRGDVVPGDGRGTRRYCLNRWDLSEHVVILPGIRPDAILNPPQSFLFM